MADEENEEGRAKALCYYRILALALGVLGGGMLTCGIIAASNVDDDIFGPPYFVGGFVVGVMALISALLSILIIVKAPNSSGNLQKKELACAMSGQYMLSMFMIMGCFMSTVLCGIGGFAFDNDRSPLNKTLAVVIMVGSVVGFVVTISTLCIVCTYGSYFGVVIRSGRRGRAMIITTNQGGMFGNTTTTTNATVFQSDFGGEPMNMGGFGMGAAGNSSRVDELERQNQLLKEQLELQRQLNEQQQQQQQQQQYGGGFPQPPPGPMYNIDPAYPPTAPPAAMYNTGPAYSHTAPPPSYDDVKHA